MAKLSVEQVQFFRGQGISLSNVFDGSGLSAKERIAKMSALGTPFYYYGGAACLAAGHTLRSKPGHCIQCDTSKIAYQLRHAASGHVYLAYSDSRQYAKVGFSQVHPEERIVFLRREMYGATSDWKLQTTRLLERRAGEQEVTIQVPPLVAKSLKIKELRRTWSRAKPCISRDSAEFGGESVVFF